MAIKEIFYQGLAELNVLIEDTSLASPNYFRILKMPSELTLGINTFRFSGNPDLFLENTPIYVEILDYNGNPVYYETAIDTDSYENIAIVSIYVTEETAPGTGTVIICSTAKKSAKGDILDTSKINVRWKHSISINTNKRNETGRYLFHIAPQELYTDQNTETLPNQSTGANADTVIEVLNSGSYGNSYVQWSLLHSQPVYVLPFGLSDENAIIVYLSAIAKKRQFPSTTNCKLAFLIRISAVLPDTGSFATFGEPVISNDYLLAATSGSIASGSTVLGTRTVLSADTGIGSLQPTGTVKSVIYLPKSVQDKIIHVRVEYAAFRLPYSSTVPGNKFHFDLNLGSIVGMIGYSPETNIEVETVKSNAGLIYTNVPIGGGDTIQDNPAA